MDGSNFEPASIRSYSPSSTGATTSSQAASLLDDDSPWDAGLTPDTIGLPFDDNDLDNVPPDDAAAFATSRAIERDYLLEIAGEGQGAASKMRAPIAAPAHAAGGVAPALGVPAMAAGGLNGLQGYMHDVTSRFGLMTQGALRESTMWGGTCGTAMGGLTCVTVFPSTLPVEAKIAIAAGVALATGLVVGILVERNKCG